MIKYRTSSPELEEEMKKSIQENPGGIDPQLMDYAKNLFPSLQTAALPKNYNQLAQQEALDNNPLPDNYNQLAQQEALDNNPLPDNYNELAQQEAKEDNFIPNELEQRARKSLANQRGVVSTLAKGDTFTKEEVAQEMKRLQAQDSNIAKRKEQVSEDRQQKSDNDLDRRIEKDAEMRLLGLTKNYDPKMLEYASTIFPSLREMNLSSNMQIPFSPEMQPVEQMEAQEPTQTPSSGTVAQQSSGAQVPREAQISSQKAPTNVNQPPVDSSQAAPMTTQETSIDQLMRQSEEAEKQARFQKSMARLRDAAIGMGLGTKFETNMEMYDDAIKSAKKPLENFVLKKELEDKQAKSDPNSGISKLLRKSLSDMNIDMTGFESIPYSQLEKMYPQYVQAFNTKVAADSRKDELSIRRMEAAERKLDKLDENKRRDLYKHIDYSMQKLQKDFNEFENGRQSAQRAVDIYDGIRSGKITPGTADFVQLYDIVKTVDPGSVVKEGEIKLAQSTISLWGKIRQKGEGAINGALLDPKTRESFGEILKAIQKQRELSFARKKAQFVQAGASKGLDKDILEQAIYGDVDSSKYLKSAKNEETVKFPQKYQPGQVVTLKNGDQYVVQEDGVTGVKK
jgi:hypothetical protein